jgi:hypothetical protein
MQACDSVIIFLHLPKCGGTTLNRLIEWEYTPLEVFSVDPSFFRWSYQRLMKAPIDNFNKIRLFKGHMPFGIHRMLRRPATYITVLRDPVDRTISSYYYARSRKLDPHHRAATNLSLEQYVSTTPNDNVQTKLIAGRQRQYDFLRGQCDADTLEAAKQNLSEHFSIVGLTERFDESLALCKIVFGWKVRQYSSFNVTRSRPSKSNISSTTRDLIAERYRFDVELYDFATRLFNAALTAHADRIQAELETIRSAKMMSAMQSLCYQAASGVRKAVGRANSAFIII